MLDIKALILKVISWIKGNKSYCIETGTSNSFNYWKYSDGTFRAIRYSTSGSTGSMTQIGSSGIYYSAPAAITLPNIGITAVKYANAICSPNANYLMSMIINRLTTSSVYAAYLRYGSGAAVSGITWTLYIEGTYE